MDLSYFRMSTHELLKKDPYIVSEEDHLIIFYSKYAVCMADNGKYSKHTSHIERRIHFVRNVENCKMHKIYWCDVGL